VAQQLSVFLENAPGRLNDMTRALGEGNINMHALFVADTSDFGVARIICDKTDAAASILRDAGFSVTTNEVVAIEISDEPGALAKLFQATTDAGVEISYTYCLVDPNTKKAVSFCRFKQARAIEVLEDAGFAILEDNVFHI